MATGADHPDRSSWVPRGARRTLARILMETCFIGLAGLFVLGFAWEMGLPRVGWGLAIVLWILGDPLLEIGRLPRR